MTYLSRMIFSAFAFRAPTPIPMAAIVAEMPSTPIEAAAVVAATPAITPSAIRPAGPAAPAGRVRTAITATATAPKAITHATLPVAFILYTLFARSPSTIISSGSFFTTFPSSCGFVTGLLSFSIMQYYFADLVLSFFPSLSQVYTQTPFLDVKVSPETPVTSPTEDALRVL